MHRKCYTFTESENGINDPVFSQKRTWFTTYTEVMLPTRSPCHILYKTQNGQRIYKPLYVLNFKLDGATLTEDAIEFLNLDPDTLKHTAEKLRWYRYKSGLLQKYVADKIGIDRTTYIHYESTDHDFYPQDKLTALSKLFGVPIESLLDDYNIFLYKGQGKQIKALRKKKGLSVSEFARLYNTNLQTVRSWEKDEVIIFKSTFEKLFL